MSAVLARLAVWRRAVLTNRLSGTVQRWHGFYGLGGLYRVGLAEAVLAYLYRPLAWC